MQYSYHIFYDSEYIAPTQNCSYVGENLEGGSESSTLEGLSQFNPGFDFRNKTFFSSFWKKCFML